MAKFFGTVQGGRGQATRLGHASSGLRTTAQSHDGSVIIQLYANSNETCCTIWAGVGSTQHGDHCIYNGPISHLFSDQINLGGNP